MLEVEEIAENPPGSVKDMNQIDSFLDPEGLSKISIADLLSLVKGDAEKYIPKPAVKGKLSVSSADENKLTEPTIAKRDFVRNLTAMFSIPDGQKKKVGETISEAAQMILDNGRLDEASRRSFFDYLYSTGVMTVLADEYYRNIRSAVKGGKLYVPEEGKTEIKTKNAVKTRRFVRSQKTE